MSAPNQGRQSPDPERQTGAQQQQPPASDPNKQGMAKVRCISHLFFRLSPFHPRVGAEVCVVCTDVRQSDSQPADASKEALKKLDSNPEHVLEGEAEKKTA